MESTAAEVENEAKASKMREFEEKLVRKREAEAKVESSEKEEAVEVQNKVVAPNRKRVREMQEAKAQALLKSHERNRKKPKETIRQKNKRKMKMGQAKFTVKSERECPDIYRPP
mmetsp:Transcript_2242/g.3236  ORF Transcript_2242/g.3236 Transcript_2242/m.3236 type:complete len:114 (+) Transcript_2242:171-512(+)